ncbi:MAG: peptidase domain-containing ABC transporter [Bacteroidales bacterium]|nr:peptidase domain-containing ABC transporter [Bacteroidales bacterium]
MNIKIQQHDEYDCGAACLTSIAAYYKLDISIARVRQYASTDMRGTNILGLINAANKIGFTAKGVKGTEQALSQIPYPTIAHIVRKIDDTILYHYVVIYGCKKGILKIMDPATGRLDNVAIEDFKKEWSGVLVLIRPSENFVSGKQKVSLFTHFKELILPHKSVLIQALIGATCFTALGLSMSIYIEKITDYVLVGGNTNLLNLLGLIMIAILVLQFLIIWFQNMMALRTGQMMDAQLIMGYYRHLLQLPQQFFDTMRVGEIISRVNDAFNIRYFINTTAISIVVNTLIVILSFALMFCYYWKLALIMLIVIPIYALIYYITDRWNRKVERKVMEDTASLESQLVESLNAVKTIKQYGIEEFANNKTENRFVKMMYTFYSSSKNSIFSANSSDFISRLFTIILMWSGSYFVIGGEITAGELMSFYALVGYFTGPVASLISDNKSFREAEIAADRLFEIMDLEREELTEKVSLTRETIGDIVFSDVTFSYGTRKTIFDKLNLRIKRGIMTAIVGESGCGKTTIANLVQNLYPIKEGAIYIGSLKLNHLSNSSVRSLISAVPQQITLFAGTIAQNIAIGEYQPNMEKIINITQKLGLTEFIEDMPEGFETLVGENGSKLSGGQKQRLAIARALYKDPEILILDEATSSLDSISERYVQDTMHELQKAGKTIIVIAHRLSTIKNADEIIVLSKGKLIETGNFEQLINNKSNFYNLWQSQVL